MNLDQPTLNNLMLAAIEQARLAEKIGEVPVGAIIARGGEIIARAHNEVETKKDASAHAELLAIQRASERIGNWRLSEAILCVTLEPCTMCAGAIRLARIPTVVFGAPDPRAGAFGSLYDLSVDARLGGELRIVSGVMAKECGALLTGFFAARRGR